MEQRKLPNATISLVLGIISFIACCFSSGIGGVLLSGIALFLANKDKKLYDANPDDYDNYSQVKTAKIIAIIGLVLGGIILLVFIGAMVAFGGYSGYQEWVTEQMQQAGM
jgi:hypothetical protein